MRTLTLHQPYAYLYVAGIKWDETRSWRTHRPGPLLIHAAKSVPSDIADAWRTDPQLAKILTRHGVSWSDMLRDRGRVIGGVYLNQCVPVEIRADSIRRDHGELAAEQFAMGNWTPDRYAWSASQPEYFEIRPRRRGAQGLWEFPAAEWPVGWQFQNFIQSFRTEAITR